jgi:tetratricopeptide (TPR) repeat protein
MKGAIACYHKALGLDPKSSLAYYNLGARLAAKGDLAGAIAEYEKAIALDPNLAVAQGDLGIALKNTGDLAGAIAAFHKAIAINPKYARAHYNLGTAFYAKGDVGGAIAAYQKAIAVDPRHAMAHTNLGVALLAQGDLTGAIAQYHRAIALNPKLVQAHTNLGAALSAKGDLKGAMAAFRRAIALDPKLAQAHGGLGQALLLQGRFTEARAATRRALQLLPPAANPLRNFLTQQLRQCEQWLKLDAKLPAFFKGDTKPADATEQLALATLCQQYKKRYAAAARFFAEAFAANAKLADDLQRQHRYNAACAAALAAAGKAEGAVELTDRERARLRCQALDWLQADLAAWTKVAAKDSAPAKAAVRRTLAHWQKDSDLAGLRDAAAVANLPETEQKAWRQLWADVAALRKQAQPRPDAPPSKP